MSERFETLALESLASNRGDFFIWKERLNEYLLKSRERHSSLFERLAICLQNFLKPSEVITSLLKRLRKLRDSRRKPVELEEKVLEIGHVFGDVMTQPDQILICSMF